MAPASAPDESSESMEGIPPHLGDFRILRRLGKGGMAEVFLAEQVSLARNVAIKILRNEKVTDEVSLKRFKAEATAAGTLNHPHIVQVYTIGETHGIHYIAQEYVAGQNLREFINKKGPPELKVAVHIMRQVVLALQAAGDAGIVHRDIKPENILLTKRGEVKIADFGLAQLTLQGERVDLTKENTTLGTPMYMSPEQVSNSKLDARSDLYSFGVTCYHMLTGSPPFNGETAMQVALKHVRDEPVPVQKLRPDLPPALCRIVEKLMAKDVEQRYQSATSVLKDLKRLKQNAPNEDDGGEDDEGEAAEEKRRGVDWQKKLFRFLDKPFRRQLGWVAATVVLVMAAGAGAGWLARTKVGDPTSNNSAPSIEKQGSAMKQYLAAARTPRSEEAWKAVITYFPNPKDKLFVQKAQEKLALLYLMEGKTAEAKEIFDQFAASTSADPEKRAFGKAGQAYLLTRSGDFQQSQNLLEGVRDYVFRLDFHMQELVDYTLRRNQEQLSSEHIQKWSEFLERETAPAQTDARQGSPS